MKNLMKPRQDLVINSADFEQHAFVKESGFREYDARWMFEKEINLYGIQAVGLGLGTMLHEHTLNPQIVVGHDFRRYSSAIKHALIVGLMDAGCAVHDIGLCLTPMAYFAQFDLNIRAVAMITASHNENGWTGIKMGMDRPLTFGQQEMAELKTIVMSGQGRSRPGGAYLRVESNYERYESYLLKDGKISRKLKIAVVCGNGTAGAFAPQVLRKLGVEVIEVDCGLDFNFPNYNPNPEDLKMLRAMTDAVRVANADFALGFDGDGDRVGLVDNEGQEIFSDKLGVLLARDLAASVPNAKFVVDVKSTSLFRSDPVLQSHGAVTEYWKTGHSYIKSRTQEIGAVAGFEKSGHFFFSGSYGHGFDDGLVSAICICRLLDRVPHKSMADLYRDLPPTFTSPTMSPQCADHDKYEVVASVTKLVQEFKTRGDLILGHAIEAINTINGVRFEFGGGNFGLVRASSNKPELVVVCESLISKQHLREIFDFITKLLAQFPAVGPFNQKI